jgi:predicted ATPase
VRIAFSGTHRVGKSTLVERLADALPRYATVDEPYHLLEEDGYECSDPPSLEDFEAQLARSVLALGDDQPDALFDRCPVDVLAYLRAHDDAASFAIDDWIDRVRDAMSTLDLVVLVPIEDGDRIALPPHEDRALRRAVHDQLLDLLVDDVLQLEAEVLIVRGDAAARVAQVLAHMDAHKKRGAAPHRP